MKSFIKKAAVITAVMGMVAVSSCGNNGGTTADTAAAPASDTDTAMSESSLTYPITIKAGYSTSEEDPRGIALKKFKETVEAGTNGDVIIEIHPAGELGSDAELISGIINGTVGMTVSSAGNYASYATKLGASALPFLFADFESAWKFVDSDTMNSINVELEAFNMHVLAYFDNGFRCVTTSENIGPINSVADMEGLNIRTPENQIVMETMSALKANPKSFPFAELKDAIKEGKFDAQENPIPVIYNNKLYEVQKYLSITNHSYDAMPLTIANDIWTELKPEYRVVIEKAAKEAAAEDRALVKQQTEDFVALLEKEGMVVNYPDLAPFKEATSGVMDVFAKIYGQELIDEIMKNTK